MRRPYPADLGLLLLTAAVVTGAAVVVTHDPAPPAAAAAVVSTPIPTPTPSGTAEAQPHGRLLLVGADLVALATPLGALGWTVDSAPAGTEGLVDDAALAAVTDLPVIVVLEVPSGARTSDRVTEAVASVRAAFPDATVALVGPFDPEATGTTAAVQATAADLGVAFVDPVAEGWTDGLMPEAIAQLFSAFLDAASA